jgi:succinate-semialdehyde dehydrogenase / glutarate-semialdehyde dehydrogenase
MYEKLGCFINGEWRTETGKGENVINPVDESVLAFLPHATKKDLEDALESAKNGFTIWKNTPVQERAEILQKTANLIEERSEQISRIITLEQGKTLKESQGELQRTVETFRWNAAYAIENTEQRSILRKTGLRQSVRVEPVGVSLGLTPWNFPAFLVARKLAPALAAGCSMILKASEETPGTAVSLVRALSDAGLPDGVVNLVFGVPAEISEKMFASEIVRKVSFTGSVPVGKQLAGLAASGLKRCTFELGGHSPSIVCEDADLESALSTLTAFKFRNSGQVCIAPSRFFVHRSNYDAFVDGFVKAAKNQHLGNGLEEDTTMGPMSNVRRIESMEYLVQDAVTKGAKILTGGKRRGDVGFFWEPTILVDVPEDAEIMLVEPFGPIVPIIAFDSLEEVISKANSLPYGLAAYVFTQSEKITEMLIESLESGGVAVNSAAPVPSDLPYGGFKDSGYGYEGGIEGVEAYLHKKLVSLA